MKYVFQQTPLAFHLWVVRGGQLGFLCRNVHSQQSLGHTPAAICLCTLSSSNRSSLFCRMNTTPYDTRPTKKAITSNILKFLLWIPLMLGQLEWNKSVTEKKGFRNAERNILLKFKEIIFTQFNYIFYLSFPNWLIKVKYMRELHFNAVKVFGKIY